MAHNASAGDEDGVQWKPLLQQSFLFLGIEHGFRIAAEGDTRAGLGGPFFKGWLNSAANLHGWADGDPFFVNYIGHPLQGSVSGYLLVRNDPKYRHVEFGRNRDYWRSRLRAAGWAWAYSTQFEIGPFSEASIGKVQSRFPQQGFVDHVITPTVGMGWMIAEDALDRYVIRGIEARTNSRIVKILARGFLNPSRSFANVLGGELPWHRDRPDEYPGVTPDRYLSPGAALTSRERYRSERLYAPFEVAVQYRYSDNGKNCNGGGATALLSPDKHWGFEAEVSGCRALESQRNITGDSLTYVAGPRYTFRDLGRWTPYVHALAGGEKMTSETMFPDRKPLATPTVSEMAGYRMHSLYTSDAESNGFTVGVGGGVDYALNRALALRVAGLDYMRTWESDVNGFNSRRNVRFSSGLVLRMGTW